MMESPRHITIPYEGEDREQLLQQIRIDYFQHGQDGKELLELKRNMCRYWRKPIKHVSLCYGV